MSKTLEEISIPSWILSAVCVLLTGLALWLIRDFKTDIRENLRLATQNRTQIQSIEVDLARIHSKFDRLDDKLEKFLSYSRMGP